MSVVVVEQPKVLGSGGGAVLNASGYVVARRRATVSSKITGRVVEVLVEEGKPVRKGQVLARLDPTTYEKGLALAQAELQATRRAVAEIHGPAGPGAPHPASATRRCAPTGS